MTINDVPCPHAPAAAPIDPGPSVPTSRGASTARAPEARENRGSAGASHRAQNPESGIEPRVPERVRHARPGAANDAGSGRPTTAPAGAGGRPSATRTHPGAGDALLPVPFEPLVARPSWVLLREEARVRGFRNALSFRRWCRRRGVPIRSDGRKQWVATIDVDHAVAAVPAEAHPSIEAGTDDVDPVAAGVRDLMLSAGRRR